MVEISPVGLAAAPTANQVALLTTFREKLCRPICSDSTLQPQVTIVYTNDTPSLVNGTVFVPMNAIITIVTPGCGCKATTQLFTEKFVAAFQGQTSIPTSVTVTNNGRRQTLSNLVCGKAHSVTLNDSLAIAIA